MGKKRGELKVRKLQKVLESTVPWIQKLAADFPNQGKVAVDREWRQGTRGGSWSTVGPSTCHSTPPQSRSLLGPVRRMFVVCRSHLLAMLCSGPVHDLDQVIMRWEEKAGDKRFDVLSPCHPLFGVSSASNSPGQYHPRRRGAGKLGTTPAVIRMFSLSVLNNKKGY